VPCYRHININSRIFMKFNRLSFIASLLLAATVVMSGCGEKKAADDLDTNDTSSAAGPSATIDPETAATITGTVLFEGTPPAPVPVKQEGDPVCAAKVSELKPEVTQEVVVTDGKLANVFVYISKGISGTYAAPTDPVVLDQEGCRYHPHVLGIMTGQKLQVKNSDATLHNIHAMAKENESFNLAQMTQGKVDEKVFDKPEVMIPISCDVHGWMRSYIGVLPHPFFSVTSTDGSFALKGLPPGKYTLTAWHEKYGEQSQEIEVKPKEIKDMKITFKGK
jgi:hypothetical protein